MWNINFDSLFSMQGQYAEGLAIKLAWSLLAVAGAMVLVWVINSLLEKMINKKDRDPEESVSGDILLSLGILLKTLVFYGGIFAAAVIVLKVFEINLIAAQDIKNLALIVLKIIGLTIAAKLAARLGRTMITHVFSRKLLKNGFMDPRRAQTLESLLKNITTYLVFFLAGLMILQVFNVNTSAILASAGILGLAIGFGAQNLVKDIISGFFILFEDQFAVGDYVEVGGVKGVVEETGLRICKIRSWTGELHIIPNGEIKKVTNYSRGRMMAVVNVGIAYEEEIDRTLEVLKKECAVAKDEIQSILEVPMVQGVTALGDFSVSIRTVAPTVPGEQWAVERELLRRFKNALDREGIEIPHPKAMMTYRNSEREG
ncbi:MAG: mechanosensitive ion channel family protein [Desulfocucumaceae bacterium]